MPQLGYSRLPAEEEAICLRVREARLEKQMTQHQFAEHLKVSRERLASYEYARAPIRWGFGDRICRAFMLSHRWLAEGTGPKYSLYRPPHPAEEDALFSAAYASISEAVSTTLSEAAELYGAPIEALEKAGVVAPPANEAEKQKAQRAILPALIAYDLQFVPAPRLTEYFKAIQKASDRLTAEVKAVIPTKKPVKKKK
jgi:transcriptional regulator with XRE-family HTH domain